MNFFTIAQRPTGCEDPRSQLPLAQRVASIFVQETLNEQRVLKRMKMRQIWDAVATRKRALARFNKLKADRLNRELLRRKTA